MLNDCSKVSPHHILNTWVRRRKYKLSRNSWYKLETNLYKEFLTQVLLSGEEGRARELPLALADRHNRWGDLGVHDSRRGVRERLRGKLESLSSFADGGDSARRGNGRLSRPGCCSWGGAATAGLHNHLRLLVRRCSRCSRVRTSSPSSPAHRAPFLPVRRRCGVVQTLY